MILFASLVLIALAYLFGLVIGRHQNDMLHAQVVERLARDDDKLFIKYNNELLQVLNDRRKK